MFGGVQFTRWWLQSSWNVARSAVRSENTTLSIHISISTKFNAPTFSSPKRAFQDAPRRNRRSKKGTDDAGHHHLGYRRISLGERISGSTALAPLQPLFPLSLILLSGDLHLISGVRDPTQKIVAILSAVLAPTRALEGPCSAGYQGRWPVRFPADQK